MSLMTQEDKLLQPTFNTSFWQKHWIKSISLILLLGIGLIMWYHKKHDRLSFTHMKPANEQTMPITTSKGVQFVSEKYKLKTIAIAPIAFAKRKVKQKLIPAEKYQVPTYTLQLIGSRHLDALEHFVAKNNLQQHAHIMTTIYQGKAWYIVTYGKFVSIAGAKNARKQLSVSLQKLHPWIKPLSSIH